MGYLDVVLEATQRTNLALVDDDAVAHKADLVVATDLALDDHAASGNADLGDLEGVANLGGAGRNLLLGRLEHADAGRVNLLDGLIDDAAGTDLDAVALGGGTGLGVRADTEADDVTYVILGYRDLEIYPGADHTSLMMVVNHEPGSLYKVLARFYALGINLIKLESRPIPDEDFEFMFYFDIDCPVTAPEFETLLSSLDDVCEEYRHLGSYSEIM